ncbi:hypothetical protein EJB05_13943, partial [Eragrostis curvula]
MAANTSVLARCWRRTWALLPELNFCSAPDNRHVFEVLAVPEAPALRRIHVVTTDDAPVSVAAWLPLAAWRLSGDLVYRNLVEGHEEEEGTIALPCFGNATGIDLNLGFSAVSLPSSGTFTRLTELSLERVRFQGTCELGDMVSSPRCPCLRTLRIRRARGMARLTLNIDAPVLNILALHSCFTRNQPQPIANISVPQLIALIWMDAYDPSCVHLGSLGQLQQLSPNVIVVYGNHHSGRNREVLWLLQHFQVIHRLNIVLSYPPVGLRSFFSAIYTVKDDKGNFQYLMQDVTYLPRVTFLALYVMNEGHAFGARSCHVLRLCTVIRKLSMVLLTCRNFEAQSTCPSGCICDQPTNWKIEKLSLNCLQEVEITGLKGADHEVAFLERLFNWAGVLKKLRITFDHTVSKSKAKELCQRLSSIARPETLMEF